MGEITGCRRKQMVDYSQTEMDLKSHRCIVNKQKVPPFFCVKVYWCHATHAWHSSNNYFLTAILFYYNPTWVWGEGQSGLNGSAFRPSFKPNRPLEPVQILCIVGHIVCLILESVAGYVERIRQARCRQANEGWTGSDGNYLKTTGKRYNDPLGVNIYIDVFYLQHLQPIANNHVLSSPCFGLKRGRYFDWFTSI